MPMKSIVLKIASTTQIMSIIRFKPCVSWHKRWSKINQSHHEFGLDESALEYRFRPNQLSFAHDSIQCDKNASASWKINKSAEKKWLYRRSRERNGLSFWTRQIYTPQRESIWKWIRAWWWHNFRSLVFFSLCYSLSISFVWLFDFPFHRYGTQQYFRSNRYLFNNFFFHPVLRCTLHTHKGDHNAFEKSLCATATNWQIGESALQRQSSRSEEPIKKIESKNQMNFDEQKLILCIRLWLLQLPAIKMSDVSCSRCKIYQNIEGKNTQILWIQLYNRNTNTKTRKTASNYVWKLMWTRGFCCCSVQ